MSTTEKNGVPSEELADAQAIIDHVVSGKPLDPEVTRRVRERTARLTEEIRKEHGVQDIGVKIIRESRGELPE